MTKIFLCMRAALVAAALLAGAQAGAQAPKAGDACYKRVFDKTASTGRWRVMECVKNTDLYFQVEFRDSELHEFSSMVKFAGDGMGDDNNNYTVVGGDSLAIDIMSERGGHVIFLHPVSAAKELSSVDVAYMNPDEGGKFNLKKSGNTLRLTTNENDIAIAIGPDGRLKNVTRPAPQK
ncbi:hypothetical protein [Massilia sp. TSP1-1-2]|uniref:hypothetical protein n=1 Tax=Massilia sp. TSP1-1-2 TaxID=2804649 RepID=UPI003CE94B29